MLLLFAAAGTIGDGLKKLASIIEPVLQEIIQKNQTESHLHAEEYIAIESDTMNVNI